MSSAIFKPGVGVIVTLNGKEEGISFVVPDTMLLSALENHLSEIEEFMSE